MSENNTEENQQEEEKKLTPAEYEKARTDATAHLTKEIVFLKVEAEYEKLMADIEESKTRGMTMIAQRAQFFARQQAAQVAQDNGQDELTEGQPKETPPANKPNTKKSRKLKQS